MPRSRRPAHRPAGARAIDASRAPRSNTVPEDYIAKVLTKPARWKIPNDYASVQRVQIEGMPLIPGDSPIAEVIGQMTRSVTGQAEPKKKKRKFSLFG